MLAWWRIATFVSVRASTRGLLVRFWMGNYEEMVGQLKVQLKTNLCRFQLLGGHAFRLFFHGPYPNCLQVVGYETPPPLQSHKDRGLLVSLVQECLHSV